MSRTRRRGLRPEPAGGWPLDEVLVGVATLRTIRELLRQHEESPELAPRGWDLALWSGVTPQGSTNSLERLRRAGLVTVAAPDRHWRAAGYRLDGRHPLVGPMSRLFAAERALVRPRRSRRSGPEDAERRDADTALAGCQHRKAP